MNLLKFISPFVACFAATSLSYATETLRVETHADGLSFQLVGESGDAPWILQHSADLERWDDVVFLDSVAEVEIVWRDLSIPSAQVGFFRAIRLEADDSFRRRFLEQRLQWRRLGSASYRYDLQQGFGGVFWRGTATITDQKVVASEVLDVQPPFFEIDAPTVEQLFGRIASAIAHGAVTIDVEWEATLGYPKTCFIDLDTRIADEEQNWTFEKFEVIK